MDSVSFVPFDIRIERVGRFGGTQGEALWWAGADVGKELSDLHRDLTDRLVSAGFSLDSRKFNPHITLGRRVVTDTVPWRIEPFGETIRKIELMKSERINGKLTYTAIYQRKV
jgi:2'-5' RNA ligase